MKLENVWEQLWHIIIQVYLGRKYEDI